MLRVTFLFANHWQSPYLHYCFGMSVSRSQQIIHTFTHSHIHTHGESVLFHEEAVRNGKGLADPCIRSADVLRYIPDLASHLAHLLISSHGARVYDTRIGAPNHTECVVLSANDRVIKPRRLQAYRQCGFSILAMLNRHRPKSFADPEAGRGSVVSGSVLLSSIIAVRCRM